MAYEEERAKDRSRLDEIADEEIRRVVARQIEIGLDVVTDGEFRRVLYTNSLQDAIEGLRPGPKGRVFTTAGGEEVETAPVPLAHARIRKAGSPIAREAAFLAGLTAAPFKVTLPAASWFLSPDNWVPGITDCFYTSHEELTEDILAIQRDLIAEAIDAGAR